MTVLRKRDVERMMADYDHDPVAALTTALRTTLDQPDLEWTALVKMAGFDCARRIRLQAGETVALDELLVELNEQREINRGR
jgi:predicted pyridoxine 5'-phosphate oxidase superfamily flavin-nucleotide-binding protein